MMAEKKKFNEWIKDTAQDAKKVLENAGEKVSVEAKKISEEAVEKLNDLKGEVKDLQHDLTIKNEKKKYCPVTLEEYHSEEFIMPKMVRILEKDPHEGLESCAGAIAYTPLVANKNLFQIIKKNCKDTGLKFYPNKDQIIYYRNPYEDNLYLNLEDYFDYIKKKRVNELEMIANKLGAKHIKITIKEEKKTLVSASAGKKIGAKGKVEGVKAGTSEGKKIDFSADNFTVLEIALDHKFEGGKPEIPELTYYKNDPDIESLIEMRMGNNPSKEKTYMLKFSQASDINLTAAMDIDAVLDKLQLTASASVRSEVEREKRLYFEYHIEF